MKKIFNAYFRSSQVTTYENV